MSKIKFGIIGLIVIVVSGVGFWLVKPKEKDSFVEKEISIKQAQPEPLKDLSYEDSSGFSFMYQSDLKIQEVEIDDKTVYSSLEITGSQPGKLTLRISDTNFTNLNDWLKNFEGKNIITDLRNDHWADLMTTEFTYGVPKLRKTTAIENKILYSLEAPADDGYWDKIRELILTSFKFDTPMANTNTNNLQNEATVVLLEEKIE